ncbi:MAG: response regulator transcription factor [Phycisphaerae bacterium]|nr:response regulator transcription factor [Phycisphaerae bacterium]
MAREIKILLVDDHALVRGALAERLQREPRFVVTGTAGTADEAITKTLAGRPDVILMDIDMPGMVSFDAAREITRMWPETRIIFLSAFMHDQYIEEALKVKARGYLTKREPPERVVEAILEVAAGGACFSEEVQSRIVVGSTGARLLTARKSRAATLRPRELETLRYIARGMSKKKIAEQMSISVKTVEHHTMRLMRTLDIHDRVGLALFAIREGLAEPQPRSSQSHRSRPRNGCLTKGLCPEDGLSEA